MSQKSTGSAYVLKRQTDIVLLAMKPEFIKLLFEQLAAVSHFLLSFGIKRVDFLQFRI